MRTIVTLVSVGDKRPTSEGIFGVLCNGKPPWPQSVVAVSPHSADLATGS